MEKSSITRAFDVARKNGRRALVGYMTAGYPSPKHTVRLCRALIDGGIDILELGIPFSDPIADGPTIQAADVAALNAGTTPYACLEMSGALKREYEIPIVFLTYYNPIFSYGLEKFMKRAGKCADGLVVPDLPEIESADFREYRSMAESHGLSTILLAAPTTTEKKFKLLFRKTSGFLYLVSLLGVTGARRTVSDANLKFIERVSNEAKGLTNVAVGFGISGPDQVRSMLKTGADGVIVGSAFVNLVAKNLNDISSAERELLRFTKGLRRATII